MKIIFNYESYSNQIISRYILCPFCLSNIEGTKIGDNCSECAEKITEDEGFASEDMPDFFDTENIDDKIAGFFFETHNVLGIDAKDNNGIEVLTATITIKGEISFEGDFPEDDTVLRLKSFHPKKTIEEVTFKEFKEIGCMHSDVFPEIEEIKQRLEFLTDDWSINWKIREIT